MHELSEQEIDERCRLQLRHPIALPGAAHKIEMGANFTVALVANKHDGQETPSQRFEMVSVMMPWHGHDLLAMKGYACICPWLTL